MKKSDYPEIIYKYRDWNNKFHQQILTENKVFMSPPIDFNDPFDCRIAKNHQLLDSQEKIEKYINDGIDKHKKWLIATGRNIEYEKHQLRERLRDLNTYQKEHEEIEFGKMDLHYGILSLSGRWDSILMWAHYGSFHRGFCIGFNEEKMRTSGLFGKGGPVTYSEDFPEINPLEEDSMEISFYQTHYKALDWEYENEYRLTNLKLPDPLTIEDRTIKIPANFVEEVNLGMIISEEHKNEIIKICKEREISIYQLEKVPFKFKLTRKEL